MTGDNRHYWQSGGAQPTAGMEKGYHDGGKVVKKDI